MSNFKRKTTAIIRAREAHLEKFRAGFFTALSEVFHADELEKALSSIASGVRHAFGGDSFIFRRKGNSAELAAFSAENAEQLSNILLKIGLDLDVHDIKLSLEQAKIFDVAYMEFDSLFELIGNMATSAACKKAQRELRFNLIASASVKTETEEYTILALLPEKFPDVKRDLGQFALLVKSTVYLSNIKERLRGLESRFDEQFIKLKNELVERESAHLFLFNEMPIAAAVLDERGVITEANEALKLYFADGMKAVGQSFSSVIDEEERRDFIELLLNPSSGANLETTLHASGKRLKAHVVARKSAGEENSGFVVYLIDETAEVNLQRELGRTIDALRAENETAERLLLEEKKHSEAVVRKAGVPVFAVSGENIGFASESAKQAFVVHDGQPLEEFLSQNGISALSSQESAFEITASRNRTFAVVQWNTARYRFYIFNEITELRRAEEELRRSTIESGRLFNSLLPTALVKEDRLTDWNDAFGSLFKDFLSADKSFDGFLLLLGESPDVCKSELQYNNIIMRTCRTTDRKFLNMSIAAAEESIFVFVEDITEQENVKQQLRGTQSLLTSSLESFSEEPVFIVENGVVSASNLSARNKLNIKLDEPFNADSFFTRLGVANRSEPIEMEGKFYRVETVGLGSLSVHRLRIVNEEITQRSEINRLRRRQEIMRNLTASDRYESILQSLHEILKSDGVGSSKLLSTGSMSIAKEVADIYLLTVASEKIEPSLSLSLTLRDISATERGGILSKGEIPDTTFMNVVSAGDSMLLIQSTTVGDVRGFASIALQDVSPPAQVLDELGKVLKAASSVAIGIHTRQSAQRQFEESSRVTRALVGLSGIGEGTFEEISHNTVSLLRRIFGPDSVGIYSGEGPSLTLLVADGDLPDVVSAPNMKFGVLVPAIQLEARVRGDSSGKGTTREGQVKTTEGFYFAVKSRQQGMALIFRFIGMSPASSELDAISSVALDILEQKRAAENQSRVAAQLLDESKLMSDFMTRLAKSADSREVLEALGDSLSRRDRDAKVAIKSGGEDQSAAKPLEIVEAKDGEFATYEVNLTDFGVGLLTVKCSRDALSSSIVRLAVDKIRSLLTLKLPAAQNEAADLRSKLERAKDDYANLRESMDKIPASLRSASIEIDGVLSRLPFLQGDDRIIQEIKLRLASAAKEISVDLDRSSRNQNEIFEAVRAAVMVQENIASNMKSFEVSAPTEFRADPATADLIKDLFVNFIIVSVIPNCRALMTTAQPIPMEAAEGTGKHLSLKLMGSDEEQLHYDAIRESGSMQALAGKLEKMGYRIDVAARGNELIMDISEAKPAEATGEQVSIAILVEDDRKFVEEETQNLLQVFSRLKVAADAVEATRIFETEKFDAAFIDLSLPSINGRELCQQLKKLQPECVTILLTNREGEEKSEGVDHIMLRPLDEESIRSCLRR